MHRAARVLGAMLLAALGAGSAHANPAGANSSAHPDQALAFSQAAIGRELPDMVLFDARGQTRRLADFLDKPLVISMVFTACAHSCSVTTHHIARMIREARNAVGAEGFHMLTIGFDTAADTPDAMRAFARRYRIEDPDWHFLGGSDAQAMQALLDRLGVLVRPSPRGFDHTVQLSVVDQNGVLYRQVYGETFPTPHLVEPLKDLLWDRPPAERGWLETLGDRIRLFCTVYDARGDRYYFDYSLFAGMLIGTLFLGGISLWLLREILVARRQRPT
jgi:protein SCO1/2